jgi:hypothetical protein
LIFFLSQTWEGKKSWGREDYISIAKLGKKKLWGFLLLLACRCDWMLIIMEVSIIAEDFFCHLQRL